MTSIYGTGGSLTLLNGLILYYDAHSYLNNFPSLIYDLSGNKRFPINNGVIYNDENRGNFLFDYTLNTTLTLGIGSEFFPLSQFTLECWIKASNIPESMDYGSIFGITEGLRLYVRKSGNLSFFWDDGTTTPVETGAVSYGVNLLNASWHHIVCTHSGSTGAIYINGVNNSTDDTEWLGTTRWISSSVKIGQDNNDPTLSYFNGQLACIKIYNRALTNSEVYSSYSMLKGRFSG